MLLGIQLCSETEAQRLLVGTALQQMLEAPDRSALLSCACQQLWQAA